MSILILPNELLYTLLFDVTIDILINLLCTNSIFSNLILNMDHLKDKYCIFISKEYEHYFMLPNGYKHGKYAYYNMNRSSSSKFHCEYSYGYYINGKKEGKWIDYYKDLSITEILLFKNNIENGEVRGYHNNGNMVFIGDLIDNKKNGMWINYYNNGAISSYGKYKNGSRYNAWYFNISGKIHKYKYVLDQVTPLGCAYII